jgi:hypothetical protein
MATSVVQECWLGDRRRRLAECDLFNLVLAKNGRVGTVSQHVFGWTLLAAGNNQFELSGGGVESYVVDLSDLVPAIAQSSFADQLKGSTNSGLICVIGWGPESTVVSHDHCIWTKAAKRRPIDQPGLPTLAEDQSGDRLMFDVDDEATDVA